MGVVLKVIIYFGAKMASKKWQMCQLFNYVPIKSNRVEIWTFQRHEIKSHHLPSRLMYLLANLGQVFLFKFWVTFWHFSIFSVRLYIVLRRREPTFWLFYCSQTVVNILLPQPTTVYSTDFSSHVRLFFFNNMVSHLRKNYYLTEDTLFQWSIYRMHLCW